MDLSQLSAPFDPRDISWLPQSTGKGRDSKPWVRCLAYVDNRAIMQRLDEVCGPDNWRNEYRHEGKAVMCGLSIRVTRLDGSAYGASEWVTKWDGSEETDIEAVKGGLSGAMKRAAVQWGIGRYLYELGEHFGVVSESGTHYMKANEAKHGPAFKWDPPRLPAWALPGGSGKVGVTTPLQTARAAEAAATLTQAGATQAQSTKASTTATSGSTMRIPGTKAHINGYGGKAVEDVPAEALPGVLEKLKMAGEEKYADVIAAVQHRLAEEAQPA